MIGPVEKMDVVVAYAESLSGIEVVEREGPEGGTIREIDE